VMVLPMRTLSSPVFVIARSAVACRALNSLAGVSDSKRPAKTIKVSRRTREHPAGVCKFEDVTEVFPFF